MGTLCHFAWGMAVLQSARTVFCDATQISDKQATEDARQLSLKKLRKDILKNYPATKNRFLLNIYLAGGQALLSQGRRI